MAETMEQFAERCRKDAAYHDRLADAAERDGDKWDAAEERAKAAKLRRQARQYEVR